jgi:outer membrane protein OmpA-like peptidoglycan-associated protein
VAVVAVVGTLATCSAVRVQHDLAEQARTELRTAGLTADVELAGRDAVVRAGAGGAGDVERAAAVVAALPGVRTVRVDGGATASPGPDASGGEPAAPSPSPAAGAAPDLVIRFGSGDTDLGAEERVALDELADRLSRDENLRVRVTGHADGSGRDPANLALSRDRANAVTDYLVAAGVFAGRVTTEAYGDSRPVAGNGTRRERALNRRVEIVLQEGNR